MGVVGHACPTCGTWFLFEARANACRVTHIPAMAETGPALRNAHAAYRHAWRAALERWLANGRPDHLVVWEAIHVQD